ncbi:MAG TPA: sigma-54 dependent transcriptional regulator [Burkholderiales bacterium]|nr:sigma-54 dependent transcriptional regulator [Burkholderiales bacterium]
MPYSILIVEDESTLAANMARFLDRHGYATKIATRADAALHELELFKPDAIVLDYNLPGMDGLEFLTRVRRSDPQAKVIMATGHGSEQVAVDAMKAGAYDYLIKPVALGQLKTILDQAVCDEQIARALRHDKRPASIESGLAKLIGESQPMQELRALLCRLLEAEASLRDNDLPAVLITGETGTGKELVARALHFDGARGRGPFVEVNCSSIPGNLLEAELFGYERGAFTDAKERKLGLIEAAEDGTLFLDEIGEMDLTLQAKLLKFLEDKTVRRLGSVRERHASARIVAATNRNLEQLVREGKFRSDLFFRLRIVQIELPPLRQMPADIPLLAQHFLRRQAERYGKPQLEFSSAALALLKAHSWPGNVRELRNLIEQSVILCADAQIGVQHLHLTQTLDAPEQATVPGTLNLGDAERRLLVQALEQTDWNVTRAARLLGVSRDVLRYRIEKYQLRLPS